MLSRRALGRQRRTSSQKNATIEAAVSVAINGGYAPYLYVILLQVTLAFLQQPFLVRSKMRARSVETTSVGQLKSSMRVLGSLLGWLSWLLSFYVARKYDFLSAALFFMSAFGTSVGSLIVVTRLQQLKFPGFVICALASIYLFLRLLLSLGLRVGP
jgi:hypothetical protein